MKGLELSKLYFEEYGLPMLESEFKEIFPRIAVGLVGHGSECFGYDDEVSKDHDYEPGFTIWLTEEDEKNYGFKLFRAYSKLPKEFMGVKLNNSSYNGTTHGVQTIEDFCRFYLGSKEVPKSLDQWLYIPDFYLAEASNGEVFIDNLGKFTSIRKEILNRPEDVRLKKLSSEVFLMAQTGQYNYKRCIDHNEIGSAILSLNDFVKHACSVIYLLNNVYEPYYKWVFKKMDELTLLKDLKEKLLSLLTNPTNFNDNFELIEYISIKIIEELKNQKLTTLNISYLEDHAYQIRDRIKDNNLRNSSIVL